MTDGTYEPVESATSPLRWIIETALLVGIAFVLATGVKAFLFQPFVIPSGSMLPTIQLGDRVIAEKLSYRFTREPAPGDIVVFENPQGDPPILIKRVIATAGQSVDLREGRVYVDDAQLEEPYTYGKPSLPLNPSIAYPYAVPADSVWVMGDNRPNSGDSREMGAIAVDAVQGRAVWTYWPIGAFGRLD